jgi:PII-like signaling protein
MELEKIPIYLEIIDHSYTILDFIKELKKISNKNYKLPKFFSCNDFQYK